MTALRDRGLNTLFRPMESRVDQGGRLKKADITSLIDATEDGRGLSKTETKDLKRVLDNFGSNMTPAARRTLEEFLDGQAQGGGGAPAGTLSGLQLRIQSAGLRNSLTGADGNPSIIADRTVDAGEAQRLIGVIRKNGIVSRSEIKDIGAILDNPNLTISAADRATLSDAIGRFVEPRGADALVQGSAVQSAHTNANTTYRAESFSLSSLAQAGVPADILNVLKRADALTGSGNSSGRVSITELATLENGAALLPTETAALGAAFALFAVSDVDSPKIVTPQKLDITDTSVRPTTLDLSPVEIEVSALPPAVQQAAQRARLVARGSNADLSRVSLSDIEHATTQDLTQTTAQDRATMSGALSDAMKPLATDAIRETFSASATVPNIGVESKPILREGDLKLDLNVHTQLKGQRSQRGSWSVMEQSHQRGSRSNPVRQIPKKSYTKATLQNVVELTIDIPPGHRLLLAPVNGGAEQVHDNDTVSVPPGDYRAVLLKDGAIVEEGALRIPRGEEKDATNVVTKDLTTEDGDAVLFNMSPGRSYLENFSATTTGGTSLNTTAPVTLVPGRYEGTIDRNGNKPFILDVVNDHVLEVEIQGERVQLLPIAGERFRYEGHFDDEGTTHELISFNTRDNALTVINERKNTYHGSSGWYAEVKARPERPTTINPDMLTG